MSRREGGFPRHGAATLRRRVGQGSARVPVPAREVCVQSAHAHRAASRRRSPGPSLCSRPRAGGTGVACARHQSVVGSRARRSGSSPSTAWGAATSRTWWRIPRCASRWDVSVGVAVERLRPLFILWLARRSCPRTPGRCDTSEQRWQSERDPRADRYPALSSGRIRSFYASPRRWAYATA